MPPQWTEPSTDEDEEIPISTLDEVSFTALKTNNKRASGPDRLNAELLKVDAISLAYRLWKLIKRHGKRKYFPVNGCTCHNII